MTIRKSGPVRPVPGWIETLVVPVQVRPSAIICRPSATWSAFVGVATEGSIPKGGYHALVAQLVEYRTFNPEAVGPSPTGRTKTKTEGCPATDNPLFHFVVIRNFLRRVA